MFCTIRGTRYFCAAEPVSEGISYAVDRQERTYGNRKNRPVEPFYSHELCTGLPRDSGVALISGSRAVMTLGEGFDDEGLANRCGQGSTQG